MAILNIEDVHRSFGGVKAIEGVTAELRPEEILAVIGPNGAGKTTLVNIISGWYPADRGRVLLEGRDITHLAPYQIAALGMGRTFQATAVYRGLSVLANIMSGAHMRMRSNVFSSAIYWGLAQKEETAIRKQAEEIIDFLEIENIRKTHAGALPLGLRRRVELGRALAMQPKLLLLDEPMAGLNVDEKEDMARFILDVNEEKDIPVMLIDHDMGVVMDICDRVIVLDQGRKIAEGKPGEIQRNPVVIKAYLGTETKN
jgi:branched-chain amino acid transport system ATP-binding protein